MDSAFPPASTSAYTRWGLFWRYGVWGPLLGGVLVLLRIALSEPGELARGAHLLIPFVLVFAYPYGLPSALSAGLMHAAMHQRGRAGGRVLLAVLSGMAGFALTLWFLGNPRVREGSVLDWLGLLFLPALVAGTLALWLERPHGWPFGHYRHNATSTRT